MPKILVTGATGTFGGLIAQQLKRAGEEVRVMVRDPSKFSLTRFEVSVGDFSNHGLLELTRGHFAWKSLRR